MKKSFLGNDKKLLKINKAKPLQLKRNICIEKYIDNYLSENNKKNKIKTSKNNNHEENKENYFLRKTQIPKQTSSIQEFEDTPVLPLSTNIVCKAIFNVPNNGVFFTPSLAIFALLVANSLKVSSDSSIIYFAAFICLLIIFLLNLGLIIIRNVRIKIHTAIPKTIKNIFPLLSPQNNYIINKKYDIIFM